MPAASIRASSKDSIDIKEQYQNLHIITREAFSTRVVFILMTID
jgi:hypothetical protein